MSRQASHILLHLAAAAVLWSLRTTARASDGRTEDGEPSTPESRIEPRAEESRGDSDSFSAAPIDPIETDRPDFTESANTVPRGHLQWESGYTYARDREHATRTRSHTAPELLLRAGLLDELELRIGWEGHTWQHESAPGETRVGRPVRVNDWSQGGADQYLGLKWKLFDQADVRPDFALIPALNVPTGGNGFSSGDVDPEIKLAWGYDVTERVAVSGNVNFATPTESGRRFFQTGASISLAVELIEGLGGYVEYYGFYPDSRESDCSHTLNTGLALQITPNAQIDWRIGRGLNEQGDDYFTGVGFAIRF